MFCIKCQADLVFCTCPDLLQRLEALSRNPALEMAVRQNEERIRKLMKES